jgi:hypothetical protein
MAFLHLADAIFTNFFHRVSLTGITLNLVPATRQWLISWRFVP